MMESAPSLFDYAASLRDIGMIEAEFAEALSGSDYSEALYAAICHVARRQIEVHIDDVLRVLKVRASHPNSNGGPWRRAIKDGVLLKSDNDPHRPCLSDPAKHAHSYRVYQSGIFHARRAA
jgi:hypothetical protein